MRVAGATRLRSSVAPATEIFCSTVEIRNATLVSSSEILGLTRLGSTVARRTLGPSGLEWRHARLHAPSTTDTIPRIGRASIGAGDLPASCSYGVCTARLSLRRLENRHRRMRGIDRRNTRPAELRMGTSQGQVAAARSRVVGTVQIADSSNAASAVSDQARTDRRLGSRFICFFATPQFVGWDSVSTGSGRSPNLQAARPR